MGKIYVVEDDDNLRELVLYALNSAQFEAEGFSAGAEFLAKLQSDLPRLVLLDIMLPGEDGLTILKALKEKESTRRIPIVLITAKGSEYDKVIGLDLGADDYITKPFSVLEMIARVKAVTRRCENQEMGSVFLNNLQMDISGRVVVVDGEKIPLTYKEFELLSYLIINKGIVLSRDQIIEKIWGYNYEPENRTVDMHIKSLRQKLGSWGSMIQTVRGVGYKIEE